MWNMFKHLNLTDKYIMSEDRNSEKFINLEIYSSIYCALWVYLGKGQLELLHLEKATSESKIVIFLCYFSSAECFILCCTSYLKGLLFMPNMMSWKLCFLKLNFYEYWMSWNICFLLMKPCSCEVSGSKISSGVFFVIFRKNYLPLISTNAAWSFGWSVLCETHCLLTLLLVGRLNQFSVCVCVYCTLTCSSGDDFRKRFRKNTKVRKKKCFSSHLTVSEALIVHAEVIEMILIPKGCSYFLWNGSPETEMVNKVVCLVLRHCSFQPAALGSLGFTLFTRLCTAAGKSFDSWSLLDFAVAVVIASSCNLFIPFC